MSARRVLAYAAAAAAVLAAAAYGFRAIYRARLRRDITDMLEG